MTFVVYGSVERYPVAPFNVLPPLFGGYMAVGLAWFLVLKRKSPGVLLAIAHDMEG